MLNLKNMPTERAGHRRPHVRDPTDTARPTRASSLETENRLGAGTVGTRVATDGYRVTWRNGNVVEMDRGGRGWLGNRVKVLHARPLLTLKWSS